MTQNLTPQQEVLLFAQMDSAHPRFRDWLDSARVSVVGTLAVAQTPVLIHQAQGKLQLIDSMLGLMAAGKPNLR